MLRLSLLIQLNERVTAPVRRIRAAVSGMARDGVRDVGRLDRTMSRLSGVATRVGRSFRFTGLQSRLGSLTRRVRELAGQAGMRGLERASRAASSAIGSVARAAGRLAIRGAAVAGAGAGLLGGWLTAGVIGTASKFEQFQTILENTEGSATAAKKAMSWVEDFAARTPYELDEVMAAFVQLKAYGLDPVDGTLRSLGDAAAGMGKNLMDAVEMIADAQTGEFERLKSFAITTKVQGEKVTFSYVKNGKAMSVTAKKNATDINRAIRSILDAKFAGQADKLSRTFAGMWANLKDVFTRFQKLVADAGIFDWLKGKLQVVLDKVNELSRNGTLQRWAEKISGWLEKAGQRLWDFATKTDWNKLGNDILTIAGAIRTLANAIESLNRGPKSILPAWATDPNLGVVPFLRRRGAEWQRRNAPQGAATRGGRFAPGRNSLGPTAPVLQPRGAPIREPGNGSLLHRTSADIRQQLDIRVRADRGLDVRPTKMASSDRRAVMNYSRGWLPVA